MVSQHGDVVNFLQTLSVPFIHDSFKAHECSLGRFSAQLRTKDGLLSNAASGPTEQPVAMLAKGLLSPVLASRGSAFPATSQGSVHLYC